MHVAVNEYEPIEAFELLAKDDLDLALTYDYNLAPAPIANTLSAIPLWTVAWGLGVPASEAPADGRATDLTRWRDHTWIVNSRNTADEDAVRTLASLAGFTPRISHRIDSLDLVEDLIVAGHGVGMLPRARVTREGVRVLDLTDPPVLLTAYAVTRLGRENWPPLRLLLDRLVTRHHRAGPAPDRASGPGP